MLYPGLFTVFWLNPYMVESVSFLWPFMILSLHVGHIICSNLCRLRSKFWIVSLYIYIHQNLMNETTMVKPAVICQNQRKKNYDKKILSGRKSVSSLLWDFPSFFKKEEKTLSFYLISRPFLGYFFDNNSKSTWELDVQIMP